MVFFDFLHPAGRLVQEEQNTPLIRKLLAGEELNALERAELASLDADALIEERDSLSRERDQLKTEHLSLKRGQRLREVAQKYNCGDPDFLDYVAAKRNVDLDNEQAVGELMEEMQKNSPHCFYSRIRSGGGAAAPANRAADRPEEPPEQDRIGRIALRLAGIPDRSF